MEDPMTWRNIAAAGVLAIGAVACTVPDDSGSGSEGADPADEPRHVKVYFEKGMFGGLAGQPRDLDLG